MFGRTPFSGLISTSAISRTTNIPSSGSTLKAVNGTRSSNLLPKWSRFSSLPDHGRRATFCWVTPPRAATPTSARPKIITPRAGVRLRKFAGSSSANTPIAGMAKM